MLVQETPNPLSMKFIPNRDIWPTTFTPSRTFFVKGDPCFESPIAKILLERPDIQGVFFGKNFITITKTNEGYWEEINPFVTQILVAHGDLPFLVNPLIEVKEHRVSSGIIQQIKELIDTRVRPMVAEDGGDIVYYDFQDGIVYVKLYGACVGCPSSTVTLKSGIERLLKYYVPEVIEVKEI